MEFSGSTPTLFVPISQLFANPAPDIFVFVGSIRNIMRIDYYTFLSAGWIVINLAGDQLRGGRPSSL
jgi:hypothetical protein